MMKKINDFLLYMMDFIFCEYFPLLFTFIGVCGIIYAIVYVF